VEEEAAAVEVEEAPAASVSTWGPWRTQAQISLFV
jgi:hypothetical protein